MIRIQAVTVSVNGTTLLDDISLDVESGRFVALVGPNGAGKTTLIRTINGLITPDAGQIWLDEAESTTLSARSRSRLVATVPQETSLGFDFDVADIVAMGRTPHRGRLEPATKADRTAVKAALDRTETAHLSSRSVKTLSGGERQRVLLARAIAQQTPILLLDEPTANLDLNHQIRTLSMARALADDGKTVLAAIHDLSLAARFCDTLVLLHDGHLQTAGTPETVLTAPRLEAVFDVQTAVATNLVTGSQTVTALEANHQPSPNKRVHIIGQGKRTASVIGRLARYGFDVTIGIVPEHDVAAETAATVASTTVHAPAFEPISEEITSRARQLVREADITVVTAPVSPPNQRLLEATDAGLVLEGVPPVRNWPAVTENDLVRRLDEELSPTTPQA